MTSRILYKEFSISIILYTIKILYNTNILHIIYNKYNVLTKIKLIAHYLKRSCARLSYTVLCMSNEKTYVYIYIYIYIHIMYMQYRHANPPFRVKTHFRRFGDNPILRSPSARVM